MTSGLRLTPLQSRHLPAAARIFGERLDAERIARDWAEAGCANQAVTLVASDREARDALWWNGFGARVVDAVRGVAEIGGAPTEGLAIRRLGPDDAEVMAALAQGLADHVAAAPINVYVGRRRDAEFHWAWLAEPGHWAWLAEVDGRPVAYLRAQADAKDVAWAVGAPENIAISGAYVAPEHRGRGIGTALVDQALALARTAGKLSCSVDFESQNRSGSGFWLRHFTPVCISVLRRVDSRSLR
jgi:GNAT superfamily N-acetyltransferase